MLPRVPKAGRRIFLEYLPFIWKRMKFKYKATARNLIRHKKHLFMTIVGIGGCTSLIVAGFGLRDSISQIAHAQFENILQYDLRIELRENETPDEALNNFLENYSESFTRIHSEAGNVRVLNQGRTESLSAIIYIPEQAKEFSSYIMLRNRKTGEAIPFAGASEADISAAGPSAMLTEKLASVLNLEIGDTFILENGEEKTASFVVTGIAENYVGSFVYITSEAYLSAFPRKIEYNTLLLNTGISDKRLQDDAISEILSSDVVSNAEFTTYIQESYNNLLGSINFVVLLLIFAAGGLAVIVLYNLTNININERNRELATLRVLGYHHGEVAGYIFREITILSIVGTIAGLLLGIPLHLFIVDVAETVDMMLGRGITPISFILSAGITLFFSALVNLLMLKKLRNIQMVDSMKAQD
jgi:putative ABC transport system permease protein